MGPRTARRAALACALACALPLLGVAPASAALTYSVTGGAKLTGTESADNVVVWRVVRTTQDPITNLPINTEYIALQEPAQGVAAAVDATSACVTRLDGSNKPYLRCETPERLQIDLKGGADDVDGASRGVLPCAMATDSECREDGVGTPAITFAPNTLVELDIDGGAGNDELGGADTDPTGPGDVINGGGETDKIDAGTGRDTVNGDAGTDTLNGDADDDTLNGAARSTR